MIAIPNTLITINPQQPGHFPRGLFFTDWQFAGDVLHPCDQEPIVQAGHLVTERALKDLLFAGCDEVQVERVDWDAEDAALQEFLDTPLVNDGPFNGIADPAPSPKIQPIAVWPFPVGSQSETERPTIRITKPDTYVGTNPNDYIEHFVGKPLELAPEDTSPALVNAVVTDFHDATNDGARIYDDEGEFAVEVWVDAEPSLYSSH